MYKMEKIKVLDDILEKIGGILQKPKTPEKDNEFAREFLGNYACEMLRLITTNPSTMSGVQFEYYNGGANKIIERYGKWN